MKRLQLQEYDKNSGQGVGCNTSGYYALANSMGFLNGKYPNAGAVVDMFNDMISGTWASKLPATIIQWCLDLKAHWDQATIASTKSVTLPDDAALTITARKFFILYTYFIITDISFYMISQEPCHSQTY